MRCCIANEPDQRLRSLLTPIPFLPPPLTSSVVAAGGLIARVWLLVDNDLRLRQASARHPAIVFLVCKDTDSQSLGAQRRIVDVELLRFLKLRVQCQVEKAKLDPLCDVRQDHVRHCLAAVGRGQRDSAQSL